MRAWLFLLAAGCGRIGFDPPTSATDGGTDAMGPAQIHCATWGSPVPVDALNDSVNFEYELTMHPIGPLVAFISNRLDGGSTYHLYAASGSGTTWTPPVQLDISMLAAGDIGPAWSHDGSLLYFASYREGLQHIFQSTYDGGTSFGAPIAVTSFTEEAVTFDMTANALELYYTTPLPAHLRRATRPSVIEPWTLDALPELSSTGIGQGYPDLSSDDLEIYFEADDGTDLAIYRARRATISSAWGTPTRVTEINSVAQDGDPELSADGTQLYFTSFRGAPNADIYVSTCSVPE